MSQSGAAVGSGSASPDVEKLTGNSGGAVSPDASFNINTLGSGSITIVGSPGTNTLTTQLTGLTNHSLLVGAGTATITNLGVATNGQLPIGSTGADPVLAAITAGSGIAISNGAGSITISAISGGFTWNTVAGTTQTIAANNGYINSNVALTTFTLPATGSVGDTFQLAGYGAGGWVIAQNAGQKIYLGALTTTVGAGGSLASTNAHDSLEIVCVVANTEWQVLDVVGNITVV